MKILTAEQTRQADAATIKNEPIASVDLMERAATAFTEAFLETFGITENPVFVFCGPGNNGGDGLAIARILLNQRISVQAFTVHAADKGSEDFKINRERLSNRLHTVKNIEAVEDIPEIPQEAIVIDGLFGSGLSRKVEGIFADVIHAMNASGGAVVAIDIPSGLYADKPLEEDAEAIVRADYTFTFQMPKLAFLLPFSVPFVGQWRMLDIGLDKTFIEEIDADYYFTDYFLALSLHKKRNLFAHKGDFGKTLLVCGSHGKMGAAVLCTRACLKAGVGLLTVHVPECGYQIMQIANPEAMTTVDRHQYIFTELEQKGATALDKYDVLGIGPGIGTSDETVNAVREVLEIARGREMPMVLDADALNILGKNRDLLDLLPRHTILTPHPKEFERLVGKSSNNFQRHEMQREFSRKYSAYVVLKGAHTCITTPSGESFFNTTGNPGMATGGSGDVLTGIILGLLAQNYHPKEAAILGVYLHGLAGDIAAKRQSQEAMIAGDITDNLGKAFKKIR